MSERKLKIAALLKELYDMAEVPVPSSRIPFYFNDVLVIVLLIGHSDSTFPYIKCNYILSLKALCSNKKGLESLPVPHLRGLYWTRTSDPIDVNDVLYQLSQQTK